MSISTPVFKISVIIPMFNGEHFIGKCLESVITQNIDSLEIIIIDDNSSDNSLSVVKAFRKDRFTEIQIIEHKENRGPMIGRQEGIDLAQGEYIFFLDCDDEISQNALEALFEMASKNNSDLVVGDIEFRGPHNNKSRIEKRGEIITQTSNNFLYAIYNGAVSSLCGILFKASFLKSINFKNIERQRYGEDRIILHQIFLHKPVISILPKITYIYNQNPDSSSNKKLSHEDFDNHLKSLDWCVKHKESMNLDIPGFDVWLFKYLIFLIENRCPSNLLNVKYKHLKNFLDNSSSRHSVPKYFYYYYKILCLSPVLSNPIIKIRKIIFDLKR